MPIDTKDGVGTPIELFYSFANCATKFESAFECHSKVRPDSMPIACRNLLFFDIYNYFSFSKYTDHTVNQSFTFIYLNVLSFIPLFQTLPFLFFHNYQPSTSCTTNPAISVLPPLRITNRIRLKPCNFCSTTCPTVANNQPHSPQTLPFRFYHLSHHCKQPTTFAPNPPTPDLPQLSTKSLPMGGFRQEFDDP